MNDFLTKFANYTNYFFSRLIGNDLYITTADLYAKISTDQALSNLNITFDNVVSVLTTYNSQKIIYDSSADTTNLVDDIAGKTKVDSNSVWEILYDLESLSNDGNANAVAVLKHGETNQQLKTSLGIPNHPNIDISKIINTIIIILVLVLVIQLIGVFKK